MRLTSTFKKAPRVLVAAAAMSTLTVGAVALSSTPAFATPGLTNVNMAVSNNATSENGVTNGPATYTWNFTTTTPTTTPAPLTSLDFSVPAGTDGSSLTAVSPAYGLSGCTIGTPSDTSDVVTVTLTGCAADPGGTPVSISISGFNNTDSTPGNFSSVVNTYTGSSALNDTGTAAPVDFSSNTTGVTVIVPDSLTFTNGNTAITLLPVPGVIAGSSPVPLTVSTNARNGYTLSGCVTSGNTITDPVSGDTISQASNSAVAALPTDGLSSAFGAQATISGTGAHLQTTWAGTTGSDYLGYADTCGIIGAQEISYNAGPTSGDVLTLNNAVGISATQTAGTYGGKITYQVAPSY
jgi:hypothetical protein